ncbi:MAG TPA: hypothetical protein VFE05_05600 [Longimicrobiaceae bacterium]|jgi:hypothetical protein|nr:hypothetical protein [Longimicrobiaceae bacterium]
MKRSLTAGLLLLGLAACDKSPTGVGSKTTNLKIGSTVQLNVNADDYCSNPVLRTGKVVAQSQHAFFLEDTQNPPGGFSAAEYQEIGDIFDSQIWPTDTNNFGTPSDLDKNGKVLIFYTSGVNQLTPANVDYIVGGFFYSRDLFPRKAQTADQNCPGSNEAEMFYLLAPDPNGTINGNARSHQYVRETTVGTVAHEFQHLINSSRRVYVNNADSLEVVWLDEGLAHVAEELNFYAASGLSPRQNLNTAAVTQSQVRVDAFNELQSANVDRAIRYYQNPESTSPFADNDLLETRGATWDFLRYAADRKGGTERDFWFSLVNSKHVGLENLQGALGTDPLTYAHDLSVSVYTDDAVAAASQYLQPSWNFRSLMPALRSGAFPLRTRLLANGVPMAVNLHFASGAYLRFGVAPGGRAEVRTTSSAVASSGTACLAAGPSRTLAVGEVFNGSLADAATLCLDGGPTGAEFTYIPFFAAASGYASPEGLLPVTVSATGVVPPVGPPTPDVASRTSGALFSRILSAGATDDSRDGGFEARLRQREHAAASRMSGRGAAMARRQVTPTPQMLLISIVRTK